VSATVTGTPPVSKDTVENPVIKSGTLDQELLKKWKINESRTLITFVPSVDEHRGVGVLAP
jgi:hypothetical protein